MARHTRGPTSRVSVLTGHLEASATRAAGVADEPPLSGVDAELVENPGELPRSRRNWGGQIVWGAAKVALPRSLEELQSLVRNTEGPLRVVGRGHSFSPVCQVKGGTLINLVRYNKVLDYTAPSQGNANVGTVRFEGGATFTEICHFLSEQSPPTALKQLPSPLFVTVVGALATGTHGSGINTKAISAHVQDIEFVTADGRLQRFERGPSHPDAVAENVANGHVGCLGVVSRMSLDVVPYFEGHNFWMWMPLERLLQHWDELTGDLHLGGKRRPLVDSHAILVWWRAGICVLNARHFVPHYDPAVAARPPAWGEHAFGGARWNLITPKAASLEGTLRNAGVQLASGSTSVAEVLPGSLAAEAGVKAGWVLTMLGSSSVSEAADLAPAFAQSDADIVVDMGRSLRDAMEGDTSMAGKEPRLVLRFDAPDAPLQPLQRVNHAYRGPWHDTVPAWALDQPLEDGPEADCGQQTEFFLPMEKASVSIRTAWEVMRRWPVATKKNLEAGIFVLSEIRSIKGCKGWVSCTSRDSVSIHISWSPSPRVQGQIWRALAEIEEALAPLGARPHWGKIYTASFWAPRFPELYGEGLRRFRALARKHDREGKFVSPWIRETTLRELE